MKKFVSFIFRSICCGVCVFVSMVSFVSAKVLADNHSAWYIVPMITAIVFFIAAIAAFNEGKDGAKPRHTTHTTITTAARRSAKLQKNAAV